MKRGGGETVSSAQCVPYQSYFQRYTSSPSTRGGERERERKRAREWKRETAEKLGKRMERGLTALSPRRIVSSRWLQLSRRFFKLPSCSDLDHSIPGNIRNVEYAIKDAEIVASVPETPLNRS